jgi:hypothetical protein
MGRVWEVGVGVGVGGWRLEEVAEFAGSIHINSPAPFLFLFLFLFSVFFFCLFHVSYFIVHISKIHQA